MKSSIWYEKYKPNKIQDMVLPEELKTRLQNYVNNKDIPSILLKSYSQGTGKSALSNSIITEMGSEAIWINASLERGIDVLRGKIQRFASSSSFDDNIKIVVLDECDNTSPDLQKALRGFLDEFSANCRFILTCNYSDQLIPQLVNRLEVYDFDTLNKKEMIKPIFEKLTYIMNEENIQYDAKDIAELIQQNYPSIRGMISDLQKFSTTGTLTFSKEDLGSTGTFDEVMESSNYMEMLERVNALGSPSSMYSHLYNNIHVLFNPNEIQFVVPVLAKYQEMNTNVRDKHLNLASCLTDVWKYRKV